jgi:monofunctional glycosyltransferase
VYIDCNGSHKKDLRVEALVQSCLGDAQVERVKDFQVKDARQVKPAIKSFIESPNSSSRNGVDVDMIVLHCSTAATVEGTIHWFLNRQSRVSAHYVVDKNGDIYQMVRDDCSAWHAKTANSRSIGIEHVGTAADRLTDAQSTASAELVRWLATEYGIPAANVVGHRFAPGNEGTTDCPNHLFGEETAGAVAKWVTAYVGDGAGSIEPRKRSRVGAEPDRRRAIELPKWARPATWFARLRGDLQRIDQNVRAMPQRRAPELTALELMTIALEDRRFFHHPGVDARSVLRETLRVLTGRKHGGASTIDMQFVRTVTGFRAPTVKRKVYEAFLALAIQFRHKKLEILRSYLACAYFGSGLIGADAAAQRIFGKNADRLGIDEAALISAMLAYPRPMQGLPKWEQRARRRATYAVAVFARRKRLLAGPYEMAAMDGEARETEECALLPR